MTGHNPTILELTPAPTGTAITALLRLLRRSYHIAAFRGVQLRTHPGRLAGSVSLGNNRVMLEANACPDLEDGSREYVTIDLDSLAYEAAYDPLRDRVHPRARQALVDFCIEVAATLKVEGFRLRFVADEPQPLSVDKLIKSMTSTDECGLVCGIAASSEGSAKIREYWFRKAKQTAGYLVLVLI